MAFIRHALLSLLLLLVPLVLAEPIYVSDDIRKCAVIQQSPFNTVAKCKVRSLRNEYFVIKGPSDASDAESLERTKKELSTLRRIEERMAETETDAKDFGVVLPLDYAANDGIIVFPYYPHGDLQSFFTQRSERLSITVEVPVMVVDVLNALVVLHDSPLELYHNDIKPSNIIVASVSDKMMIASVKLIDFERARKQLKGMERAGTQNDERYFIEGTTGFLSPEEVYCFITHVCYPNYDEAAKKSDMWAFGITLYQLIFLHEPFMFQEELDGLSQRLIEKYRHEYLLVRKRIMYSRIIPLDFKNFLLGLITWDYTERLSAAQARQHPYFIRIKHERRRYIEEQNQRKKKSLLGSCFNCFKSEGTS